MELGEHLAEMRKRLIRSVLYVFAGTLVGYLFYGSFFRLLTSPVAGYLKEHNSQFLITHPAEGFMIEMVMSFIVGLILAFPFLTCEGWGFVAPALTRTEKRGIFVVAPLSVILFWCGILAAYWVLPSCIKWLASQNPPGAVFMPSVQQTLMFILKMCLAFGIVFQLPVVLMFFARIGIINSRIMKTYWRHAVVLISIIAAVTTPSNDAFTMMVMCVPMVFLYVLSIGLVKMVEKHK
ncbi:MAG TPA: twin-arginine translocase subunit TatC [Armatimonadota bacterium]